MSEVAEEPPRPRETSCVVANVLWALTMCGVVGYVVYRSVSKNKRQPVFDFPAPPPEPRRREK